MNANIRNADQARQERRDTIRRELTALGSRRFTFADCPGIASIYLPLIRVIRVLPENGQKRITEGMENHFDRLIKSQGSLEDRVSAVVGYIEMISMSANVLQGTGINPAFASRLLDDHTISHEAPSVKSD